MANRLDIKGLFSEGFTAMREKLANHFYTSASAFSSDFSALVTSVLDAPLPTEDLSASSGALDGPNMKERIAEFKDKRKLAKRIVKAVQGRLEDVMHKESELCRRPYEKELRDLDMMLEASLASRRDSFVASLGGMLDESDRVNEQLHVSSKDFENFTGSKNPFNITVEDTNTDQPAISDKERSPDPHHQPTPDDSNASPETNGDNGQHPRVQQVPCAHQPPTPPLSSGGDPQPLFQGGIPWYMETFDPVGTTIYEERWTGRDLAREMSEELSDMDEDELSGLVDIEMSESGPPQGSHTTSLHPQSAITDAARRKAAAKRRRRRNFF